MIYLLEGLIFTILAADTGGMQGQWAKELGLPFGALAESVWILVPIAFVALSIPTLRKRLGRLQHLAHVFGPVCVLLPVLIFFQQTSRIPLRGSPSTEAWKEIRERFDGRILIMDGGGGARAYLPRSIDRNEAERAILRSIQPSPQTTRKAVAGKILPILSRNEDPRTLRPIPRPVLR